ncbi:ABC transporter substrate-binding protein [Gordonia rubripertincta]|uniref:ABC transporter substrate-binding protein n=1 Tax=Gordonia rubripertincta TaxID=36822 RepID=A0ABT4MPH9_GORRU|nr:ABC transporter substrate-binding protein [Gordonia rubripertincta]MCZ4548899.1 ABC transporter substrate-binding protein [Gordonia rubripertincta]
MTKRSRLLAVVSAGAALSLVLSACSGGKESAQNEPADEPVRGGTLTYAFNTESQSVDPVTCALGIGLGPCQAIYGALMYYNIDSREFQPGMAESFTTQDGKEWTLKLRPNLTFTDGTPFDADAVAFNWNRALDPALLSPSAAAATGITWQVSDPTTLLVTSKNVDYQLPNYIAEDLAFIGSPTAIKKKGKDFGNAPVGAGPFIMTNWARGTQMTLDRNPQYWDQPRPYADRLVIKTIPADDQRYNALQAGEINVMAVTLKKYADRAESAGMNVSEATMMGGTGVQISDRGPLADPRVREAVGKVFDNEQIMNAVYPGEDVATGFTPADSPFYDPSSEWPAQDIAGAQKLIDDYRAQTGGREVELTFTTTAGSPVLTQVGELLQAQFAKVNGLNLKIVALDGGAFYSALTSGNYDLIISSLGGANPENLYKVFTTDGPSNTSGFSDPGVDQALEVTHTSNDPDTVNKAYADAIGGIVDANAYRFWRHAKTYLISPSNVNGIENLYSYWFRSDLAWVQQ